MRKLKLLFACLLMAVLSIGQLWGETVTYTVSSASAVTTTGTAPDGSSAALSGTGSLNSGFIQCTSGQNKVLTLSGFEGHKITAVTIRVKSNSSKGAGSFSVVAGSTTLASISDSKFNTANWNVAWSTTGVDKALTMTEDDYEIQDGENVVLTLSASANSLYIQSYTLTYEEVGGGGGSTPSVSVDPASWDFGTVAVSDVADKEFLVSGSNLTAGNLTLSAPSGFTVSPSSITVSEATLASTPVTVSKNTSSAGTYDGNLTISGCGLEDAVEVALSMEVKAEYTVTWNNNGSTSTTQVLDGDKPVFPATPAACDATSTTFIGWATEAWTGKLADLSGKTVYTSASAMPAVDAAVTYYAVFAKASGSTGTLFEWAGGTKSDLTAPENVSASGLGSDYAESNAPYQVKFDTEGDYIIITTSGAISSVSVGVKMIGGNATSHILVQEAEDAESAFSTVESLEISGAQNDVVNLVTTNAFNSASRAVKLLFNKGANVGVGPISIVGAASSEDYMTTCCTKYNVNIAAGITNGSVSADPASACEGTIVTLTFTPILNYHLSGWTLNGTAQDVNNNTFTMPAEAVTVSATFAEDACTPLNTPSVTVSGKAYPYDAVQLSWAAVSFADAYKVYIYDAEDNELEHDDAFTGVEYTIGQTLSGSTTYKYSVQAVSNTPTVYCPSTAATGTFVTDALPTAHLTLVDIDGTHASSGDYAILTPFNLPTTAAACAKTFVGWDADADCATAPTYAKGAEYTFANTTGVTLYAVYADAEGGNTDVVFNAGDYAEANNWTNGTAYTDFTINGVNFKANGGGNNGKYYTSDQSWRMYSGGSVVLTVASGNIIAVSSTPSQTFTIENGSASLSLSATVKFTAITVTVAADAVYSNYSTTCAEKTATPTFTLAAGTYTTAQTVGITCATDGATIYYTTDGTTPSASSTEYTAAIELSTRAITTIKAIAVKADMDNSEVAEATYTISLPFATVSDLITYATENNLTSMNDVIVTGVVSEIKSIDPTKYERAQYYISDNGTAENQLYIYNGYYLNGTSFTSTTELEVGDKVTIQGNYTTFGTTKELDQNNQITAITKKVLSSVVVSGTPDQTDYSAGDQFLTTGLVVTANYSNTGYSKVVTDDVTWETSLDNNVVTATGEVLVTATYNNMVSDPYAVNVTVSSKALTSIELSETAYTIYKEQTYTKPTVTAHFDDNSTEDITAIATDDAATAFDNTVAGPNTVTVSYTYGADTKTAQYTVTVQAYANADDAPYTVTEALAIIEGFSSNSADEIVVAGTVSVENKDGYKNRYKISDGTNELLVYGGKGFNEANFTADNYPKVGDVVVVKGNVINYHNETPEFASGKSYLLSQVRPAWLSIEDVAQLEVGAEDMALADLTITTESTGDITYVSEDETKLTIVEDKLHAVALGTVTVTANMAATNNVNALNYAATSTTFQVTVVGTLPRYAVTFDANGGEGNAPVVENQLAGATFNLPANTFTYTGFQFAGWNDGTTTYGAGAEYTMPAQAVTFKAQWNAVCPWASVYTSNVSFAWTGESGESNSKVKINDTEYVAQKVGSGDKTGSVTVTVPAGTHTLHFHAAAWNSASSMTIAASGVTNMSVSSFAIAADAGVKNSGTYTLAGDPIDQHFHFTFDAVADETVITFSKASGDDKRFVMYGINQEGGPELQSITIGGNATNTEYVYGQTFNPAGLTVSAVYRVSGVDQEPVDVTDRVVWTFDPAEFNSTSQTSVTATATFETKSASKTVDVTVSEPATPNVTYTAIVVKKGDKYYAMGQTLSSGALNAVELEDVVNGKMVNVPVEDRTALTWIITETEDGATFKAQNGKYLSGNGSNTTLSWSTEPVVWAWNDTYGCYAIGGRSFYMYNSTTQFKNFALSNMNNTPSQCSSKPENLSEYIDIDNTKEIVTLRSGLENGKIGTMCWNAAIYEVEGAYFFEPEAKMEDGVCFAEAAKEDCVYPAGKPYVFQATGEEIRAVVSKTNTTTVAGTNKGLHGTFERIDVPNGEGYYIIYQNKLYTANNNYIEANRAYIDKSQLPGASSNPAPGRRRLVIGRDNLPTGVDAVVLDGEQVQKVLIDGQIYIVRDGKMYDLTGRMIR